LPFLAPAHEDGRGGRKAEKGEGDQGEAC